MASDIRVKSERSGKQSSSLQRLHTSLSSQNKRTEILSIPHLIYFFPPHVVTSFLFSVKIYRHLWLISGLLCPRSPGKLCLSEHKQYHTTQFNRRKYFLFSNTILLLTFWRNLQHASQCHSFPSSSVSAFYLSSLHTPKRKSNQPINK